MRVLTRTQDARTHTRPLCSVHRTRTRVLTRAKDVHTRPHASSRVHRTRTRVHTVRVLCASCVRERTPVRVLCPREDACARPLYARGRAGLCAQEHCCVPCAHCSWRQRHHRCPDLATAPSKRRGEYLANGTANILDFLGKYCPIVVHLLYILVIE